MNTLSRLLTLALLSLVVGVQPSDAQEKLFLWKVTSEAGTAYLYGSIHLARPEMYPLDDTIEQAFRASDNLVIEARTDGDVEADLQALSMELGRYDDGATLGTSVAPATFEKFVAFLAEKQLPVALFQPMRPWMAAVTLEVIGMQQLGFDGDIGIERHFLRLAKHQDKGVHELETAESQLRMIGEMPDPLQEMYLLSAIEEQGAIATQMESLIAAWSSGDTATMEELILEPYSSRPEMIPLYTRMFTTRNIAMAEKVADMVNSGDVWFVVVGAGHMLGDQGIPALLAQRDGIEVVQVDGSR